MFLSNSLTILEISLTTEDPQVHQVRAVISTFIDKHNLPLDLIFPNTYNGDTNETKFLVNCQTNLYTLALKAILHNEFAKNIPNSFPIGEKVTFFRNVISGRNEGKIVSFVPAGFRLLKKNMVNLLNIDDSYSLRSSSVKFSSYDRYLIDCDEGENCKKILRTGSAKYGWLYNVA